MLVSILMNCLEELGGEPLLEKVCSCQRRSKIECELHKFKSSFQSQCPSLPSLPVAYGSGCRPHTYCSSTIPICFPPR